jgi:hypothetical protein
MSTESWIAIGAVAVFVGGAFVYAMFMVFLPEWVGIAGKTAAEAERSHRGDRGTDAEAAGGADFAGGAEQAQPSWLDRMQGDAPKRPRKDLAKGAK